MTTAQTVVLHALGQLQRVPAALSFARTTRNPEAAQRAYLKRLLTQNADTEYGRAHGFSASMTAEDFARRVPLMTPADFRPLVNRMMNGEQRVLLADTPRFYARTSGSTGAPTNVPVTATYRAEFQRTVQVSMFHMYRRFPEAFRSRVLYFAGQRRQLVAPDGCDVGTMSGYNFSELPPPIRALYAWPAELFGVGDLRTRTYLALWLAVQGDISLITGVYPAPIVFMLRELPSLAKDLARDARAGTLPAWLALSPEQRAFFSERLRPDTETARRFERAAEAPAERCAVEAFPSLRLVYCWLTATAGIYVPELKRQLPGVAVRDAIYSASEGWGSIPIGDEETGGALAIESIFFEFIEEQAYAAGSRDTRFAWQLEDGKRYLIVMSDSAGVYRYLLGDVMEVCGFHNATPRVRFVRKFGAASNLIGEKLLEEHV
ncbi:MAG: GH3 auxin-responsive promoter family protein, partial [Archangium sp.]|nr:GH3 auxin-responsive promoter family protein [Archangium sp.]